MASDGLERELLEVESQRYQAMFTRDLPALDAILADELIFSHVSGQIEDKQSFLNSVADTTRTYLSYEYSDTHVRELGPSAAALLGRARIRLMMPNGERTYPVSFLNVFTHRDGRWQMVVWHPTTVEG